MADQDKNTLSMPKVIKRWAEPVGFRRHRLKQVRKNQMALLLHAWTVFALLLMAGGIAFAVYQHGKSGPLADKGALIAFFGLILTVARFSTNLLSFIPMPVVLKDDGIQITGGFPPTLISWGEEVWFHLPGVDLGGRTFDYLDVVYRSSSGGLKRFWAGLASDVAASEVTKIMIDNGATPRENLEELVPLDLLGAGQVLDQAATDQ